MSRITPSLYICLMPSHASKAVDPTANKASSTTFISLISTKLKFQSVKRYHSAPYGKVTVQLVIKLFVLYRNESSITLSKTKA